MATAAKLNQPVGVAVDAAGDIFIADTDNSVVRKVDQASGIITTIAGNGTTGYSGIGGLAVNAELNRPNGLTVDSFGNVFIADTYNNVVREVDASTKLIFTVAGTGIGGSSGDGGLATAARLNEPTGIAVDGSGNLYIADYNNDVVREVNALGLISIGPATTRRGMAVTTARPTAPDSLRQPAWPLILQAICTSLTSGMMLSGS